MATNFDPERIRDLAERCVEFADCAENESVCITDGTTTLGEITRREFRYLAVLLGDRLAKRVGDAD